MFQQTLELLLVMMLKKIEGDGTDLTIAGNNINLTAVADVVITS